MALSDYFLYQLSQRMPDRMVHRYKDESLDNNTPGTEAYNLAYARFQFNRKVRVGLGQSVMGLDILELGCGHGGISCFMAVAGARSVIGIDLNVTNLRVAERFAEEVSSRLGFPSGLHVAFKEMRAETTDFADNSFDTVVADNLIEHVDNPLAVMKEAHRVLRPGGSLLIPNFPSILSRNGLHLKYGFNIPWANLLFSDETIIKTLRRIAQNDATMYSVYPGLSGECNEIKDVRRYKDLNGMKYARFKQLAKQADFQIVDFTVSPSGYLGKLLTKVPLLRNSTLTDVMSVGASAVLRK